MRRGSGIASVLLLLCLAMALVAGCGSDSSDESTSNSTKGAKTLDPAKAESAKGNVTWCIGKDTTGAYKDSIKAYEKSQSNVKVKLLELPEAADEQRTQQIQRLRAKSDECDVLGLDVIWTSEYAGQKWLYDLSDAVKARQSEFIKSTLGTAQFEDKYWGIPYATGTGFLYYRKDKVKKAPTTYQQAYADGKANDGYIYQGSSYEGLTVAFLELLYSNGGSVLSEDGKDVTINSPEAEEALKFMADGVKNGSVPKAVTTYKEEEARRAFESGKATLERNYAYAYKLGKESKIKNDFAISTLPGFNDKPGVGVLGGFNLGISAYSKNPNAALNFVNYLSSPKAQVILAKTGLPPVLTESYDDPEVKKTFSGISDKILEGAQNAKTRPTSAVYPQVSEAIYKNVYSVISDGTDPKAALDKMQSQIEKAQDTF